MDVSEILEILMGIERSSEGQLERSTTKTNAGLNERMVVYLMDISADCMYG